VKYQQALGLVVGLVVGITGGILFSKSLRPDEGSMQDRMEIAEEELGRARRSLTAMERHVQRQEAMIDGGLRDLGRDFKDGKDISPDDLFATMKPWMRKMAPIFERLRRINEEDWTDAQISEWSRKYDLSDGEKEKLKERFVEQSRINAERLTEVVNSDESGFVELIRATEFDWQDTEGVDTVMEGFLEGEQLENYRAERLAERVNSVQTEADRNLQRLDNIVKLDDAQHEQLFGVLVRSSKDYRPEVKPEGFTGEATPMDRRMRDATIRSVLKPEQIERLDEVRNERRDETESKLQRAGLVLPKDWDLLEGDLF